MMTETFKDMKVGAGIFLNLYHIKNLPGKLISQEDFFLEPHSPRVRKVQWPGFRRSLYVYLNVT